MLRTKSFIKKKKYFESELKIKNCGHYLHIKS